VLNYQVPSTNVVLEGSGSGDAGMKIWKPAMSKAMEGKPDVRFKEPPSSILEGKQIQIPDLSGLGYFEGKNRLERMGFTVLRRNVYSSEPPGTFLGFSPGSGEVVPEFSEVYGMFSAGRDPAEVAAEQRAQEDAARQAAEEARRKAEEEAKRLAEEQKQQRQEENGNSGRGNNSWPVWPR
jgi:beta-lactam-binding protein with PASTA domain